MFLWSVSKNGCNNWRIQKCLWEQPGWGVLLRPCVTSCTKLLCPSDGLMYLTTSLSLSSQASVGFDIFVLNYLFGTVENIQWIGTFFFFCKNLFAMCKYTHFSTGQYKNCFWSTNFLQNTRCARGSRCYLVRWWEVQQWKNRHFGLTLAFDRT
jgi:hypothetical protein